ncbi:MAG TPA: ABC transporter permease, partial [Verrucomicrobiae bacterium]|nr:ABC transporter permease [Verrucomicrobiae bacterium]
MIAPLLLYSRIAARNVRRNIRRSSYAAAAVSAGVVCLLVFQALKVGLHDEMVASTLLLETGSMQIHAGAFRPGLSAITPLPDLSTAERALSRVGTTTFAPRLRTTALASTGSDGTMLQITGVDPQREQRVTTILQRTVRGRPSGNGEILVGEEFARTLHLAVGDELDLTAQDVTGDAVTRSWRIGGMYRTALGSFDRTRAYVLLSELEDFLGVDGPAEIAVKTNPAEDGPMLAALRQA